MQRKRQRLVPDELFENCGFQNGELDALISPMAEYGSSCLLNEDPTQLQLLPSPQRLGGGFLEVSARSPPHLTEANGDEDGILTGDEQSRTGSVHEARLEHLESSFDHQWMSNLAGFQPLESLDDTSNGVFGSPETDGRLLQDVRDEISRSKRIPKGGGRFRPNEAQKRTLEQHFLSGFARVTPELVSAVQCLGEATERQIVVWLKNRLARCKQHQSSHRDQSENEEPFEIKQTAKEDNIQALFNFDSMILSVLDEMELILRNVDLFGITALCSSVRKASQIVCYGIGKEGHIMNKFASDLHCLGFHASCLSDVGTLPVSPKDLFIVSAGPSCYSSVSSLALEARRMGASVVAFTAHRTAGVLFTEDFIRIPAQTRTPSLTDHHELTLGSPDFVSFLPEGRESVMNMGSSYEVGMSLVHASILFMLRQALKRSHKY